MKNTLGLVAALVIGIGIGAFLAQRHSTSNEQDVQQARTTQAEGLAQRKEALAQLVAETEARASALEDECERLREQLAKNNQDEPTAQDLAAQRPDPSGDEDRQVPTQDPAQAYRERQQRGELRAAVYDRLYEILTLELGQLPDPAAQERVDAIGQQLAYMADLRTQLESAETEDQENAVAGALIEAGEYVQALVREHQDDILRRVAAEYGITDPEQQDAFVQSLRDAQNSPVFQVPSSLWTPDYPRGRASAQ